MVAYRLRAILTIPLAGAAAVSEAQWQGVTIYEENDTLILFNRDDKKNGKPTDEFYTQGLRLVFTRNATSTWGFSSALHRRIDKECREGSPNECKYAAGSSLVIGQVIETPQTITSFRPDRNDRPYAGYLYGGVRTDVVRLDGLVRHALEADIGFLGPPALAKPTQKGFHVLRRRRIPKGWDFELGMEPQAALRYTGECRHLERSHFFSLPLDVDLTGSVTAALGTLQIYPGVGATLRAGFNLTGFPQPGAPWTLPAVPPLHPPPDTGRPVVVTPPRKGPDIEFAVFGGLDARYFIRNAYLDGSLLGGSPSDVRRRKYVRDRRYGLTARYGPLRVMYTQVHRSPDFEPYPADRLHRFGSLAFDWEPSLGMLPTGSGRWFAKDWQLDIGLGSGLTRLTEGGVRGRSGSGPSGRVALSKGLMKYLTVGGEYSGAVQEGGPPDEDGVHHDTFLLATAVTIGVRPFGGKHPLHARVGFGRAIVKREFRHDEELRGEGSDTGRAFLAGIEYLFRLGNPLSLGLNTTWAHLKVDGSRFPAGQFLATNLTVRWFPGGRWR